MTRKERFDFVLTYFQEHNPEAETELAYESPYQLLVAVILSAQCTDKRVNMTTPPFFKKFPDPKSLAKADPKEVLGYHQKHFLSQQQDKAPDRDGKNAYGDI